MKQPCISMKLHSAKFEVLKGGILFEGTIRPELPEGCIGIMFVFESKKSARKFDSTAELTEIIRMEDN